MYGLLPSVLVRSPESLESFPSLRPADRGRRGHHEVGVAVALVTAQAFGLSSFLSSHLPFSSGRSNS